MKLSSEACRDPMSGNEGTAGDATILRYDTLAFGIDETGH
jgi:hypothetical protein